MATTKLSGIVPVRATLRSVGVGMLQNPMTDETLNQLIERTPGKKSKGDGPEKSHKDIAKDRLCLSEKGEYGIPMTWLFASLVAAGRHVIYEKKSKFSTAESSLVPAFLSIQGEFLPFKNQDPSSWVVDKRRGVLKSGMGPGVAVGILRPKFPSWELEATIEVDCDQVNPDKIRDLVVAAGRFCGLGDFRPGKKGPFGRFVLADWQVMEQEVEEQQAA